MIEGKVARVINENNIAINIGRAQGVQVGMEFEIYTEGPKVRDPDTGEVLGQPEIFKGVGEVKKTHDDWSILRIKTDVGKGGLRGMVSSTSSESERVVKGDKIEKGDKVAEIIG